MKRFILAALILCSSACATSAQQLDPAFLNRAVNALQLQRNASADAQAVAEAKLAGVTEDLAKANARIKELTDKYEAAKPEPQKPEANK